MVRRPWSVPAMEGAGAKGLRVGAALGVGVVNPDLAKMIDHTLLKPEATRDEVVKLCEEARKHRFASVCVNTTWVPVCKSLLHGTDVMVCAVVGFPLGAMTPTAKAYEAREAMRQGAQEIRHGDQHRRAQVARLRDRVRRHLVAWSRPRRRLRSR